MWQTYGHEWATGLLQQALDTQRIAHAYLITGPAHVGKATLARDFAAALSCTGQRQPCDDCRACRLARDGGHPDILVVQPHKGTFKIAQIRDLQRDLALSPYEGRYRICVLIDMHLATDEAENALLKTLEEPTSRVVLVLTALDPSLLLPTVVSRCQLLALRSVPEQTIARVLTERWQATPERAQLLARLAAGRIGWAIQAVQDDSILRARDQALDDLQQAVAGGRLARLRLAESLGALDPEQLLELSSLWQSWWRDLLCVSLGCDELAINLDRRPVLHRMAAQLQPPQLTTACSSVDRLLQQLAQNVTARLALEDMLLSWPLVNA